MTKRTWINLFGIVFLFLSSFAAKQYGSRMPFAIDAATRLSKIQPAPIRDIPVDYHGADILRFIDNQRLLVGAVNFDDAGTPVHGPVILYDMQRGAAKWRIQRERHHSARHQLVAVSPHLVLRTNAKGQTIHRAFDPDSGKKLWDYRADEMSRQAYDFSSSLDMSSLYSLSDELLTRIDMRSGAVKWQTIMVKADAGSNLELIALDDIVVLVGNQVVSAYGQEDGRRLWHQTHTLGAEVNVLAGSQGLYLYSRSRAMHVNTSGKIDWQWRSRADAIKLMAPHAGGTYIVTHTRKSGKDRLHAISGAKPQWTAVLPGQLMSPLLVADKLLYLTTAPQQTESGRRTLVGVNAPNGRILARIHLDPTFSKAEIDYVPLPDKLIRRKNRLLVLRENCGITAINLQSGKIAWTQPMAAAPKAENMSLMSRVEPGFNLALKDQYKPAYVSANLKSGQSALNMQLKYQHLQQSADNLTRRRPNLGNSASATAASMKMQRDFNTAVTALGAMNALVDASNAFWKAYGESLIRKTNIAAKTLAITGIRIAEAQYHTALSRNYFLPAPTETLTLVDLNSGQSAHLTATLAVRNLPGRSWTAALSPDETRLVAVGIGLNHTHYTSITRGMLEVPASSIVVYNPATLAFKTRRAAPTAPKSAVTAKPPPAAATVDAAYMIQAGYPPLVAYAMGGTLADVKKMLAAGENVNTPYAAYGLTPLMAATSRGDAAMVKLLLEAGADVHAESAFGKTAYELADKVKDAAVREKIKKLLSR